MPSKSYALERGGPERVGVSWDGAFKNVALTFDAAPLGSFATAKELETAQSLPLPDGSRLEVVIAKFGPFPELRIARDGEALPGTSGDPQTRLEGATNMLFAVAVLNAAVGLIAAIGDIGFLQSIGIGWGSVVAGALYAGLAALVKRRSTAALAVAVTLFVLDGVYTFVAAAEAKVSPPIGGLVARFFFLMPMVRGFSAIRELQKPQKRRVARSAPVLQAAANPAPSPSTAAVPGAAPTPPPPPAPVRTFTGEAEKRRLAMSERLSAPAPTVAGRRIETKATSVSVDTARKALRFIAHKIEIGETGLRVTLPNGGVREVPFAAVARIVTRQLPPDPPWEGAFLIDAAPSPGSASGPDPVRIFATTTVNYAAIPGGGSTSRLENTRKLTAFLRDRCPAAVVDEPTAEFIRGPKVPLRFANMAQFIEYDATYG